MSRLFCGIDIGTTNLKVLLLDESGKTLWVKSVPAPHLRDELGVVTDARQLVAQAESLIIKGWRRGRQGPSHRSYLNRRHRRGWCVHKR